MQSIKQIITRLIETMYKSRKVLLALSCLVVFIVTYVLILPAFTLEKDEAAELGGIDVPGIETEEAEADISDSEAAPKEKNDTEKTGSAKGKKESKKAESVGNLTFEGEGFTVAVDDTKSVLPNNTEVVASELLEKPTEGTKAERKAAEKAYKRYYDLALEAVKDDAKDGDIRTISFVKFYDIALQSSGEEVQPNKPVNVTITYDKAQQKELKVDEKQNVRIIHFAENQDTGEITAEILNDDAVDVSLEQKKITETTFEAEGFSVYGVVYTVDFSYEVDGKAYEYSIGGGEGIGLSELLPALGVIEDDKNTDANEVDVFVSQVEDVKFSDSSLVSVSKADSDTTVGGVKDALGLKCEYSAELSDEQKKEINGKEIKAGDWVLISLRAFDTEEKLKVAMKNGDQFEIKVTDAQANPYGLNGKTFSILASKGNTTYSLRNAVSSGNGNCLSAYTVNGAMIGTKWTFEWTGEGKKYLIHDENNNYIIIENNKVRLADRETANANPITVISKEGKYSFVNDQNVGLNIYGINGFGPWPYDSGNSDFMMTLQEPSDVSKPGTIETADTSGILQINLFNYGPENQLDKEANNNTSPANEGVNVNHALKFFSYGKRTGTGVNDFTGDSSVRPGIVADQLGSDDYPYLDTANEGVDTAESLGYLFGAGHNSVTPYTGVNHLFTLDEDGYYRYDSNDNYAYYNPANGNKNFKVYSKTFPEEGADDKFFGVGFFPFNDYDEYYNCIHGKSGFEGWDPHNGGTNKAGHYDHHFGMSLAGNFIMPPEGIYNGNDVTYEFSGDDDMWVYIDGVLILDIGGIHNPAHGSINFTDGTVTVNGVEQTNLKDKYKEVTGKDWDDSDFSNHDFRVFYMERGGMYSNLEVTFNLPLTEKTETGNFEFDKVSAENESLKLAGAKFALFTNNTCTDPFTLAAVPVTATSDKNGKVSFRNIPYGTYYMKESEYPTGYQAKSPAEVFTVTVDASGATILSPDGNNLSKVTNEPKKINVDVEKVWANGVVPEGASVEVVLGRYKLAEDPNAQGTGTLVIKDSYAGLPDHSSYHVTYTITGPDNYSKTIRKTYTGTDKSIEEIVEEVPAGVEYTVTKQVQAISHYDIANSTGTQTVTVPKKDSVEVEFPRSTFNRNAYTVTVYAVDKNNNSNIWLTTTYYPANATLYIEGDYPNDSWKRGKRFLYSFDGQNYKSFQLQNENQYNQKGRTESFILNQDMNIYIKINEYNSDWNQEYDWFKPIRVVGANPVRANASSRMMMAARKALSAATLSQTAAEPTLPNPPKDLIYVLDQEYAQNPGKITLSGSPWTGTANDLTASNEYGPYVYYIAAVNETGMPEGTQIAIANEVTMDGSSQVLTVTNTVPTGSLQITKTIQKNGETDSSATGTFFYAVYEEEYNPEADPAQVPVRRGSIGVTQNGTATVTESGLYYGTYYVYELTGEGGTPVVNGDDGSYHAINNTVYNVSGSGSSAVINGESDTATASLTNNHETVDKTAEKTWEDGNPENLTVYFKLYRTTDSSADRESVPGAEIKAVTPTSLSVEWKDLEKYSSEGEEYIYSVEEVNEQGEIATPVGYHAVHTDPLEIKNTHPTSYEPTISFSGTKEWIDNSNQYGVRPENLTVTLYSHNKPKDYNGVHWTQTTLNGATVWISDYTSDTWDKDKDIWKYTFTELPAFNDEGVPIDYFAVETLPDGYQQTVTNSAVSYTYGNFNTSERHTPNNEETFTLSDSLNIAFMAVKYSGNSLLVWSPRKLTNTEKEHIFTYLVGNGYSEFEGKPDRVTYTADDPDNIHLPFSFVTKKGTINISMSGNDVILSFRSGNGSATSVWEYFTVGELKTTYTTGTTAITNTLKEVPFSFTKEWKGESGAAENWAGDISVKITRDYTDKDGAKHTEDVGTYTIAKDEAAEHGIRITGTRNPALTLKSSESYKYVFTTSNLPMSKEDGDNIYPYHYQVSEVSGPELYRAVYYLSDGSEQLSSLVWTDNGGKIVNEYSAYELPHTGGIGTTIFYILGSLLVVGSAVVLISRRRIRK